MNTLSLDLTDQVALVTGSTGGVIARTLTERDANIAVRIRVGKHRIATPIKV